MKSLSPTLPTMRPFAFTSYAVPLKNPGAGMSGVAGPPRHATAWRPARPTTNARSWPAARLYPELEPGSALFFHSNLLHCSAANDSPHPRWALICCYNTVHNPPFRADAKGQYTPLEQWDDEKIRQVGERHWQEVSQAQGEPA